MNALARMVAKAQAKVGAYMMPDSCEIQTDANLGATDGAGGQLAASWATVSTVACQVSAVTTREATIADKLSEVADYQITLPAGAAVTAAQRIKHTANGTTTYYGITGVRGAGDGPSFELARTVLVQVVSP